MVWKVSCVFRRWLIGVDLTRMAMWRYTLLPAPRRSEMMRICHRAVIWHRQADPILSPERSKKPDEKPTSPNAASMCVTHL
eukprot:SM000107S14050  [mRNA]  locus=s107:165147:165444:- [translate_table: standard]